MAKRKLKTKALTATQRKIMENVYNGKPYYEGINKNGLINSLWALPSGCFEMTKVEEWSNGETEVFVPNYSKLSNKGIEIFKRGWYYWFQR